jgi:hypothetical protein
MGARTDARPKPNTCKGESQDLRLSPEAVAHHLPTDTCQTDPDLPTVIAAWDRLPAAVKAGIVAMVRAAGDGR